MPEFASNERASFCKMILQDEGDFSRGKPPVPISPERSRSLTKGKGIPATADEDARPPRLRSVPREQKDGGHGWRGSQSKRGLSWSQPEEARSTCVHPFSYVWWNKEGSSSLRSFAGSQPKRSCYRAPPYQRLPVFGQSATESSTQIHQPEPHPLDRRGHPVWRVTRWKGLSVREGRLLITIPSRPMESEAWRWGGMVNRDVDPTKLFKAQVSYI